MRGSEKILGLAVICCGLIVSACNKAPSQQYKETAPNRQLTISELADEERLKFKEKCTLGRANQLRTHNDLVKNKQFEAAYLSTFQCAELLDDKELTNLVEEATLKIALDSESTPRARREAIDRLEKKKPELYKENSKAIANARLEIARSESDRLKEQKNAAAAERLKRKKEGVQLGMSEENVRLSSWGRPQSINRTTGSFGIHEQWIYGGQNYLYFENGRLTTIQN